MNVFILKVGKCLRRKMKIMNNENINKTNINWDIPTYGKSIKTLINKEKDI